MVEERTNMEPQEAFGTIIGTDAGCVVVKLEGGNEILCRSVRRMHRPLGFFMVPIGRRARVRLTPNSANHRPLILEVLPEDDA